MKAPRSANSAAIQSSKSVASPRAAQKSTTGVSVMCCSNKAQNGPALVAAYHVSKSASAAADIGARRFRLGVPRACEHGLRHRREAGEHGASRTRCPPTSRVLCAAPQGRRRRRSPRSRRRAIASATERITFSRRNAKARSCSSALMRSAASRRNAVSAAAAAVGRLARALSRKAAAGALIRRSARVAEESGSRTHQRPARGPSRI